jgi:hypothetical protein
VKALNAAMKCLSLYSLRVYYIRIKSETKNYSGISFKKKEISVAMTGCRISTAGAVTFINLIRTSDNILRLKRGIIKYWKMVALLSYSYETH